MSTILIIEDDKDISGLLEFSFKNAGYTVKACPDGESGLEALQSLRPALLVLDVMLPGLSGLDVLKELRRNPESAPTAVIMLTAKGEELDRVLGLELGADDYVVKPFSVRELLLRAKGLLGRSRRQPDEAQILRCGSLAVDLPAHRATLDGRDCGLTATEFKLLAELMRRRGRVLSRDALLENVWGYTFDGYARTVDTHMRRLRRKIGPAAGYIETLRGVGYRFVK